MASNTARLEELFDKYVRGTISSVEFNEFWQLVKEGHAGDALSAELTALWQEWETRTPESGPDKAKVFNRIMAKGREREIDFGKLDAYSMKRWLRPVAAAAVLLLLLAGGYLLYILKPAATIAQVAGIVQTQHPDRTRHIVLPDGSTVILHAGSKLDYPSTFPANIREITLSGEAYFDVRHDDRKPFVIHTGKVRTTVLGTAFNIRWDSSKVTVSVTGGKVRVENDKKVLAELSPNEQIVYNTSDDKTEQKKVDAGQLVTSWTKQDMVFDGDSFGAIAGVVSKRYGVTIRFKNPELAKCQIVASFSGTETLEFVLETLCTIRSASYVRNPDSGEIEIDGKGCE